MATKLSTKVVYYTEPQTHGVMVLSKEEAKRLATNAMKAFREYEEEERAAVLQPGERVKYEGWTGNTYYGVVAAPSSYDKMASLAPPDSVWMYFNDNILPLWISRSKVSRA